jgi:hypothetical protein
MIGHKETTVAMLSYQYARLYDGAGTVLHACV